MLTDPAAPTFFIREIPVYGDLILAPMDGISDLPFRSLARRLGSAMSYTEFINARDVLESHPYLPRRLAFAEFERPIVYQIFDDDPDRLLTAAQRLMEFGPDVLDVNLGCSAKTVTGRGAGAALLREPGKIERIFSRLTSSLPVPVTAKMRLGWDESSRNFVQVAKIIEENGGQLIAVHGRTKKQGYSGEADWDAIAQVKQAVTIPVIANGDVRTVKDIERIFSRTGCDAVMIGRAAVANPWIFSRRDLKDVSSYEARDALLGLFSQMISYYGVELGVLLFRKFSKRILLGLGVPTEKVAQLITTPNPDQVRRTLEEILQPHAV